MLPMTLATMTEDAEVSSVAVSNHHLPWPAQRLLLAVLDLALRDYRTFSTATGARGQRLLAELDEWFWDETTDSPFAFVTICDALSLDADYLRAQLRRLQFRRGTELVSRAPSTDRLRGRLGRCRPRLPDGRPACARAARGPSPGR